MVQIVFSSASFRDPKIITYSVLSPDMSERIGCIPPLQHRPIDGSMCMLPSMGRCCSRTRGYPWK